MSRQHQPYAYQPPPSRSRPRSPDRPFHQHPQDLQPQQGQYYQQYAGPSSAIQREDHLHHDRYQPPPPPPIASSSRTFAFRPPAIASLSRTSAYAGPATLPTPSTSRASTSPTKGSVGYRLSASSSGRDHRVRDGDGDDDLASSGEDGGAQKLEVKREKNRLKQRNLRLRRANHVSTLEASIEALEKKSKLVEAQHEEAQASLKQYVARLEAVLRQNGLEAELWASQAGGSTIPAHRATSPRRRASEGGAEGAGREKKRRRGTEGDKDGVDASLGHQGGEGEYQHVGREDSTHTADDPPNDALIPPASSAEHSRPTSSTSSFAPIHLGKTHTSHFSTAPSPRSIRIEDLLSPSLALNESPPVPVSAYTIGTPYQLAPAPSEHSDQASSIVRRPSVHRGGHAMSAEGSSESLGSRSSVTACATASVSTSALRRSPGYADAHPPVPLPLPAPPPLAGHVIPPHLHPSIHTARLLFRVLLAQQPEVPISHCILPPLNPQQQTIILNAIYNLTTSAFRDEINASQVRLMPAIISKILLEYSYSSKADLRVILMPIAILRGRIVGFLTDGLPFDITAFVTHVLADARIFGDTGDPDSWEMSDTFWDVWGGWFKAGRHFCGSLSGWRRRHGHTGSNIVEILLGLEGEHSRMTELIGRPPEWVRPVFEPPAKEMVESVELISENGDAEAHDTL